MKNIFLKSCLCAICLGFFVNGVTRGGDCLDDKVKEAREYYDNCLEDEFAYCMDGYSQNPAFESDCKKEAKEECEDLYEDWQYWKKYYTTCMQNNNGGSAGGGSAGGGSAAGGTSDGGSNDGGSNDGGNNDGGTSGGGTSDGGGADGGSNDGGSNDGGSNDGGSNDGGNNDGGSNDGANNETQDECIENSDCDGGNGICQQDGDKKVCIYNNYGNAGININTKCLLNGQCSMNIYETMGIRKSNPNPDVTTFAQDVILGATKFFGTVLTILFIVSGLSYVMAGFSGKAPDKAKKMMIGSIVGLLFITLSYTIIRLIQFIATGGS